MRGLGKRGSEAVETILEADDPKRAGRGMSEKAFDRREGVRGDPEADVMDNKRAILPFAQPEGQQRAALSLQNRSQ